ncbi:hypothetical protein OESDEN_00108 [Oesophagostomum dentatum]|uniref:Uncharacterized protein n=1 Tax=Oesophagostomum dentatum TaxID=61180 RepID=A0A0B1TQU0_OESDE|nr:hypothetical protein OESDEN_00108 [Oesophagostomum dentatum]
MVASTLAQMEKVQPLNIEDEKGLLTVEGAQPIVEALVDNALASNPGMYDTSCPEGCEHSRTPWIWWFTASAVANVFLVAMAIIFMMLSRVQTKESLRELTRMNSGKATKQH